jgi:hypothetical protein
MEQHGLPNAGAVSRRIFVSYSSADKPVARRVVRRLRQAGASVFIDEDKIEAGQPLRESIEPEIRRSTHVVVVWTDRARASAWVQREIECAVAPAPARPTLIPLLFAAPTGNAAIENAKGVDFSARHRFEESLARAQRAIFGETWAEPDTQALASDLERTLNESPTARSVVKNPINASLAVAKRDQITMLIDPQESDLQLARDAFGRWVPEGVSVAGLPVAGDADFYALDFVLWCAAQIALKRRPDLTPLLPPELATYPPIFAKVFGATSAGFEALLLLRGAYPGLSSVALAELDKPDAVSDAALGPAVELFEAMFRACARNEGKDQFTPFSAAQLFVRANRRRLSLAQKQKFLQLVTVNGDGPYPGPPLDLLSELAAEPALATEVIEKIRVWVASGLFDRSDEVRRSDSPRLFWYMAGHASDPTWRHALFNDAHERIRKLLRSNDSELVVAALRWIADADRLPLADRHVVEGAVEEGLYSSEFEGWSHAKTVAPLVRLLLEGGHATARHVGAKVRVSAARKAAGLPDHVP